MSEKAKSKTSVIVIVVLVIFGIMITANRSQINNLQEQVDKLRLQVEQGSSEDQLNQ